MATILAGQEIEAPRACVRCGEAFARPDYLHLHRGRRHAAEISDDERLAFEEAVAAEELWLVTFRKKLKAGLGASVPMLVWLLATVLLAAGGGMAIAGILLLAPSLMFSALAYLLLYEG